MTTVLRVRRKRTNDPAESLVFSCSKKARTTDGESTGGSASASKTSASVGYATDDEKKVFKFAGTVGKKDEPIAQQIEEAIKKATQKPAITSSKPTKSITKSKSSKSKSREKSRSIQQKVSQTRRFQILSSHRGIDLTELDTLSKNPPAKKTAPVKRTPSKLKLWNRMKKAAPATDTSVEDEAKKLFCLYDVAQDEGVPTTNGQSQAACKSPDKKSPPNPDVILCNSVQMVREKLVLDDQAKESDYVYDLYYIEDGQLDMNGALAMGGADQELFLEYLVSQEEEEFEETYDDDSDSNDENNWRNEYPEDEPDKRHLDLFDELIDDYCYGDQSSDEDFGQYSDIKKKTGKRALNYNAYESDDDLGCYS
ncbi:probable RNA polymerase II nuclear localization protein SLC7A6OS isoform X1 [Acanthaster planci]|uniref:Probable RNA polymerase II nuclear localization protein SLC7A6OS n=1 Tax=Acanthaster planci TaxID=133434 RepID=A0A8B7XWC4_ACAPL|nr:probable RNA polymerase II nuclear localization protein SLC7A6OS isoform X1 [Acanthaster planci]